MRLLELITVSLVLVSPFVAADAPLAPPDRTASKHAWCATSPSLNARLRLIDAAARQRMRERDALRPAAVRAATSRFDQGIFVVDRDDLTIPFDTPFDLEGTSYLFEPVDGDRYRVRRVPLEYDESSGPSVVAFRSRDQFQAYDLTKFAFPFYGIERRKLYFAASPSVYFETPAVLKTGQYGPLELITDRKPLIAPYLFATQNLFTPASVSVRQDADRAVITWQSFFGAFPYDIQMVLHANGAIRIAYKIAKNGQGSAFVFTSGAEPSRLERTNLATITDPRADTRASTPALLRDMVDIESVTIDRIGESELLEVSIKMAQPIVASQLGEQDFLQFVVFFDDEYDSYLGYVRSQDEQDFFVSAWGGIDASRVRVEGSTITMPVLQRYLPAVTGRITAATYVASMADEASSVVTLPPSTAPVDSDISALEASTFDRPLVQGFTLGVLNPDAIWDELETTYQLNEADYDGVAIYQTFYTDIITFATAYSTVGNAGADGVWHNGARQGIGERFPRSPALLHMNKVGHSVNGTARGASFLLHHEFGHHWLYNLRFMDNAAASAELNPVGAHPAQYVHTPAKNNVFVGSEYSAMGGSNFTDVGDGTFRSAPELGYYSYSPHELYLMGLAPEAEVTDWFFIQDSEPALGQAYHAPTGATYAGTRKNVSLSQLTGAMGTRKPAFETSPKEFKVLFVLMEREADRATPVQIAQVAGYARNFVDSFSKATGGRGTIVLSDGVCTPPAIITQPASAAVAAGAAATFTIEVLGTEPIAIQWYLGTRGDTSSPIAGATSKILTTQPIFGPTHVWARATNACGTADSAGAVVTIAAPHRRGARR